MFKYNIINNRDNRQFQATFKTLQEGDSWRDSQIAINSWGKPDRWTQELEGDHYTDTRTSTFGDIVVQEYFYPCEYTITVEDVTSQIEQEQKEAKRKADGEKARLCCTEILDYIAGYNIEQNFSAAQILQLAQDNAQLFNMLNMKMVTTAKSLLSSVVVDGVMIKQELVDGINRIFSKFGI